jgi:hypothetical protein
MTPNRGKPTQRADDVSPAAQPPEARVIRGPVGWLLGPELVGQLHRVFGIRSDPRNWMMLHDGFIHDEYDHRDGRLTLVAEAKEKARAARGLVREGARGAPGRSAQAEIAAVEAVEAAARTGHRAPRARSATAETRPRQREDVWFDYIADIGDATDAMYAIAYAAQIDLEVAGAPPTRWSDAEGRTKLARWTAADRATEGRRGNLPRGQFLFVGGDTGYHVADRATLKGRVVHPFQWAMDDLGADASGVPGVRPRLYGIPGNHDWYDDLHAFSFMFRRGQPSDADRGAHPELHEAEEQSSLKVANFVSTQLGSCVAIQLPFQWRLWGLDIYRPLDAGQARYFDSLAQDPGERRGPSKLILCTPSPPIAFGAVHPAEHHAEALGALGLPELYRGGVPVPKGTCRLDLAGDMHHYARYAKPGDVDATVDGTAPFAAVISGLGGAFHHPTFTRAGDEQPLRPYPDPDTSRNAIARGLLHPRSVLTGSWVRAIVVLLTILLGFASTSDGGMGWLFRRLLGRVPRLVQATPAAEVASSSDLLRLLLLFVIILVGVAGLVGGYLCFRSTYRKHVTNPEVQRNVLQLDGLGGLFDPYRSYWRTTGLVIGVLVLWIAFSQCPLAPSSSSTALDVVVLRVILGALLGGPALGWFQGGKRLPGLQRAAVTLLGMVHTLAQLSTPLVCARFVTTSWVTAAVGIGVALMAWVLLVATRVPFKRRWVGGVLLLWLLSWLGGTLLLFVAARGHLVEPSTALDGLWRFAAGGVVAIPISTSHFAWYLAATGLLNGHNNEVGGAARITEFRQLIRFHVHDEKLTGYVIKVTTDPTYEAPTRASWLRRQLDKHLFDDPQASPARCQGRNLRFELVDVFTIQADG